MLNRMRVCGIVGAVVVCVGVGAAMGQVVDQGEPDDLDQMIAQKLEGVIERAQVRANQRGQKGLVRVNYFFKGYRSRSGSFGSGTEVYDVSGSLYVDPAAQPEEELPELERIEEEGEANEVVFEYQMIDYARDLLAGKYSDQLAEVADSVREQGGDRLPRLTRKEIVEEAVGAYGIHLTEHPEDWFAMRELAVGLLELGRVSDAADLMHAAYSKNPELGIFPVSSVLFGEYSERAYKDLVVRAVQDANRKPSGEGWLLVGVLMQAQGRVELAGQMIDRAAGLGLESEIVEGLKEALP